MTHYAPGDWNGLCGVCGFKYKFSDLRRRWDGLFVCRKDYEPRQPQDFVRAVPDRQAVPVTRPERANTFIEDTTPDAFSFADITGVIPGTVITSAPISVNGLNGAATLSVSGGSYKKNDSPFTTEAGVAANGDEIQVRHTSSVSYATTTDTVLTIGSVSGTFSSTTHATVWNSADKGGGLSLSRDMLTVSKSASGYSSVRAVKSYSSGKHYFEIQTYSGSTIGVGLGLAAATLEDYVGFDASAWGWLRAGARTHNGPGSFYASWAANKTIGCSIDFSTGDLVFYVDGVSQGTAYTGLSGELFPMASLSGATSMSAKFLSSDLLYLPAGFSAWPA